MLNLDFFRACNNVSEFAPNALIRAQRIPTSAARPGVNYRMSLARLELELFEKLDLGGNYEKVLKHRQTVMNLPRELVINRKAMRVCRLQLEH